MRHEVRSGAAIVSVRGEVDRLSAAAFQREIAAAAARGRHVIVDLSGASYFDAAGAHLLAYGRMLCWADGRLFVVVAPPGAACRQVIEALRLDREMLVVGSLGAALDAVRPRAV